MNERPPSLVQKHCEKLILGAAVTILLYVAAAYLVESPNMLAYRGRIVRPGELNTAILQDALALERDMRSAALVLPDIPCYHRELKEQHNAGILRRAEGLGPRGLRLGATFGMPIRVPFESRVPTRLITPLPPTRPILTTGRSLRASANATGRPTGPDSPASEEVGWVSIGAELDTDQLTQAMLTAGYPPYATNVHLVGIDVQRQEWLATGEFSNWCDVALPEAASAPPIPTPLFDDHDGQLLNRDVLDRALENVKATQAVRVRPPFGQVMAGDQPPTVRGAQDDGLAGREPKLMSIRQFDEHAQAGRIYRYRMRVRLWNRFVGRSRAVRDRSLSRQAELVGQWSEPSELIKAAPSTHFFVLGPSLGRGAANVEVWKWHRGSWVRGSFSAATGDTIGGIKTVRTGGLDGYGRPIRESIDFSTGVVVLSVHKEPGPTRVAGNADGRFQWTHQRTLVLVCQDQSSGRVFERSQARDRADPLRSQLRHAASTSVSKRVPPDQERALEPGTRVRPTP